MSISFSSKGRHTAEIWDWWPTLCPQSRLYLFTYGFSLFSPVTWSRVKSKGPQSCLPLSFCLCHTLPHVFESSPSPPRLIRQKWPACLVNYSLYTSGSIHWRSTVLPLQVLPLSLSLRGFLEGPMSFWRTLLWHFIQIFFFIYVIQMTKRGNKKNACLAQWGW